MIFNEFNLACSWLKSNQLSILRDIGGNFSPEFQMHPEHNVLVLVVLILKASFSFGMLFIIMCGLCQRMTNAFDEFNEFNS